MAYGIEEIAKMQVTGPVQGGDMIMKPDQAPVGAAALLNKMQNKNTPGIFKLPMPDKEMPNFMKVAAEGVEQQTAKGDTINQMAGALLRQGVNIQGMGMDEIIQIYEQTFGSPGDVDEFGVSKVAPSDWRTILKMIQSGMSEEEIEAQMAAAKFPGNFTQENQNVVELPRNLKTAPDNPETELAYITNDEKALLALMNPGTPHEGPEGVPTYDEGDYLDYKPSGMAGTGYQGPTGEQRQAGRRGEGPGTGAIQETMLEAALAGDTGQTYGGAAQEAGYAFAQPAAEIVAAQKKEDAAAGETKDDKEYWYSNLPWIKKLDAAGKFVSDWEEARVKKLLEDKKGKYDTGMGQLLYELGGPDSPRFKDWFDKRGDIFDEVFEGETLDGEPIQAASDEEKFDYLVSKYTGKTDFDKKYTPKDFYGSKPGESSGDYQKRMRKKGVTAKELADMQMHGKLGYTDPETGRWNTGITRGMTMMIEEGRKRLEEDRISGKGVQDKSRGGGGPVEQVTEEEEVVTETDPRAGQFNVGGTMPYTDALYTQGTEMDVPLGRRFEIDKDRRYLTSNRTKDDIYKYATEGGYSQLEPFQNYLARRREYLGEDEPVYFDEEGNVIYSDSETV